MDCPPLHFPKVAIVGVGMLGASLGLALKQRRLAERIVGIGRPGSPSLAVALRMAAVDAGSTDLASASADADLIILCTPIRQFPAALQTLATHARPGALITDVGSTKADVMRWASEILAPRNLAFVGSHPMAGSEKRGPDAAYADLYQNAMCLICQSPADGEGRAFARIEALWRAVGMRTLRLEPAEHDRWVAMISHLPHAAAFSLMNAAARHPEMLQAVAGGFLDSTRVASSDPDMWTDIFLTNPAAVIAAIDEFTKDLGTLRGAIAAGDEKAIRKTLADAKRARDDLLARRSQENGGSSP